VFVAHRGLDGVLIDTPPCDGLTILRSICFAI